LQEPAETHVFIPSARTRLLTKLITIGAAMANIAEVVLAR
jgi:hypothetical protein